MASTQHLTVPERREVLSRLLAEQTQHEVGTVWKSIRFSANLRVISQTPEQEMFIEELQQLLLKGALVRVENQSEGTYEIFGINRTFYVTMSEKREFVGLLSSWLPENPPVEVEI
jgi:hypothetical protein